jgi:putative exporter of polyketide antibiotics
MVAPQAPGAALRRLYEDAVIGAILGLVSAAGVGFRAGQVDGVDWTGSIAFGSVVALTFLLITLIAVILAQLLPTASSARVAGALALAGGFALRAAADTQHHPWLQRITPLGLRTTVELPPTAPCRWPSHPWS